jgi:ABC-2 type transport system permease protein
MSSLSTLIRLEFIKAVRRPMTWILAIIFFGFLGFMYTVLTLATFVTEVQDAEGAEMAGLEEQLLLPDGLAFGSSLVVGVGAVIMIIFAAGIYGSEFGWTTIRMMLMMRAGRAQLVVAKLLMIAVMSLLVTLIGMAIVFAGSLGAEIVIGDTGTLGDSLSASLLGDTLLISGRSAVAIFGWALIGGMLALAFHSFAIGTGLALAGYFIGDLIVTLIAQVGTAGEWVSRLAPSYGLNGMIQLNQVNAPDLSSAEIAGMIVSLILWALAFLALGMYRFKNMDVIAKST